MGKMRVIKKKKQSRGRRREKKTAGRFK